MLGAGGCALTGNFPRAESCRVKAVAFRRKLAQLLVVAFFHLTYMLQVFYAFCYMLRAP